MAKKHSELTDPNLHNPKSFAAASNETALTKNVAGALEWAAISGLGGTGPAGPIGPAGSTFQTRLQDARVATTSAITLSSDAEAGDTIDGVSLSSGNLLLIKDQADQTENGPYVVQSSGAPVRASGASSAAGLAEGDYLIVKEGTVNGSKIFAVTESSTVGVDNLNFDLHDDFQDLPPLALTNKISVSGAQGYLAQEDNSGEGSGTTFTVDWDEGNNQVIDLQDFSSNVTLTLSNPNTGAIYVLKIIQSSTARTVTWPAAVKWPGGTAPTISTGNNDIDLISLYYDGTNYLGNFAQDFS